MRTVTYGADNSSPDQIKESWQGVDTVLSGRKTYEFGQNMSGGPAMKGIRNIVFSRTLERVPEGHELVREDAVEFVARLKAAPGGDILVMGGGELGTALIEGGLVDEIGLNIHPVLLGRGTPLFRPLSRRVELELIEARAISQGCVLVRWRVVN